MADTGQKAGLSPVSQVVKISASMPYVNYTVGTQTQYKTTNFQHITRQSIFFGLVWHQLAERCFLLGPCAPHWLLLLTAPSSRALVGTRTMQSVAVATRSAIPQVASSSTVVAAGIGGWGRKHVVAGVVSF